MATLPEDTELSFLAVLKLNDAEAEMGQKDAEIGQEDGRRRRRRWVEIGTETSDLLVVYCTAPDTTIRVYQFKN